MPRVLIADKMSAKAEAVFKDRGIEVDVKTGLDPEALAAIIGEYDGLAVRSATKVTGEVMAAAGKLKAVGRAGIGVDNIDTAEATARGIVVMNTPFGNAITTAEHAIALMFACARQIPAADRSTQAGKWEKSKFMGVEITGKTLGVIGCGNIGAIVAERAQGLRMKVVAHDPYLSPERARDLGVERVGLDELFARADFITLHAPMTDQTRGIIDAKAIARMKDGVRIVNCARGGLVVEADLRKALEEGKVAGAAFDVFTEEPAKENVLFGAPNFVATPHLGASTEEAQENVAVQVAEQLSDFLLTGAITNAVNMASVSVDDAPRLRPYMTLAEQMGSFAGQITESGITGVTIEYEGEVAGLNTRPITAALLTGLLRPFLEAINIVNAAHIARERDIDVAEVKHERADGDYRTKITLTVRTERRERAVSGTLVEGARPRLVQIEDVAIEAGLGPHMLFTRNQDKPGFIGKLGTLLGDAGINIATFHLGRTTAGGDAIALIEVDQPLPEPVMWSICQLPQVVQCKALRFEGVSG